MRKDEVIDRWSRGVAGKTGNNSLSTDGVSLFSYNLRIGYRSLSGSMIVGNYTSKGGSYYSQTTSTHVGLAARSAHYVMHPTVFENSPFPGFNV